MMIMMMMMMATTIPTTTMMMAFEEDNNSLSLLLMAMPTTIPTTVYYKIHQIFNPFKMEIKEGPLLTWIPFLMAFEEDNNSLSLFKDNNSW